METREETRQPGKIMPRLRAPRPEREASPALDLERLVWDPEYRAEVRATLGTLD